MKTQEADQVILRNLRKLRKPSDYLSKFVKRPYAPVRARTHVFWCISMTFCCVCICFIILQAVFAPFAGSIHAIFMFFIGFAVVFSCFRKYWATWYRVSSFKTLIV